MSTASDVATPVPSPVLACDDPWVHAGPLLLAGLDDGPGLAAHRRRYGDPPFVGLTDLVELTRRLGLRGRGGAAFPFATKLAAASASRRRAVVVVNGAEGEPASCKDTALMRTRPHLVLDGAVATASALGAPDVHVVLPGDRPAAAARLRAAMAERRDRVRLRPHVADPAFVAGQSAAVLELLAGRPNRPVTGWVPAAESGHRGRPTVLSNAETFAHVGVMLLSGEATYSGHGPSEEPGTTLLTLAAPWRRPEVLEAAFGTPLADLLPGEWHGRPLLVGGYHGTWASWSTVRDATVSVDGMRRLGVPLGAGLLLSAGAGGDPWELTRRITDYLAGESAGRCGP